MTNGCPTRFLFCNLKYQGNAMKFFNNVAIGALTGLTTGALTGYLSGLNMESLAETSGSWAFRLQAAAAGGIYGFVAGGLAATMIPDSLSDTQRAVIIGAVSGGVGGGSGAYPLNKAISAYYIDPNAQYSISPEELILSYHTIIGSIFGLAPAFLCLLYEAKENQAQNVEENTALSLS